MARHEIHQFRNRRTPKAVYIALGLGLAAFVILVFVVTLVKLGGNVGPHF